MAYAIEPEVGTWTAVDLAARFGPIPIGRIRLLPAPGTAREEDVVEIHDREDRLYELVDGVLVDGVVLRSAAHPGPLGQPGLDEADLVQPLPDVVQPGPAREHSFRTFACGRPKPLTD